MIRVRRPSSPHGHSRSIIRQIVDAIAVPAEKAKALQAEPGSPALKIVRRYLDAANEAFEITVSMYPAGRLTLSTDLIFGRFCIGTNSFGFGV